MKSAAKTDIGLVRKVNEDNYICHTVKGKNINYFAVADGMGGHNAGEVASSMAVREILEYMSSKMDFEEESEKRTEDVVVNAIVCANEKIYKQSILSTECIGMGTTISLAVVKNEDLYIGHVGDSRIYLIRNKKIRRLTEDHSLVTELIKSGSLKPEDANSHPQKNIITRALGTEFNVEVDLISERLKNKDYLVLCTDGLSNLVEDKMIMDIVLNSHNLESAAMKLVEQAKAEGGHDNITVVVAYYSEGGDCDDR